MKAKRLLYTAIILFPFFSPVKSKAQNRERHRSVTINQTVVDGKVISSDTIITYTDTTTRTINSKEVSMDLPYTKGSTVYIDNSYRKLNIKQSKDGKVKLSTTAFFYGEPAFTNEQWLEKLNITMKNTDTGIAITSGGINSGKTTSTFSSVWNSGTTDWNGVIAERNEAALDRAKATLERSKASIERNRELVKRNLELAKRNQELLKQNKTTIEQKNTVPQPPIPPLPPVTIGISGEASVNGSRSGSTVTTNGGGQSDATVNDWWGRAVGSTRGFSSVGNSTAVFDEKGNNVYNSSSLRRELTLYIPADAKLNVVSKYADVNADHDLKNLKIKVSNGSLDMVNVDDAVIISTYSNISAGNITNGNISASLGKLSLKNADQLTLNTRYNKVEIDNCNRLDMKSTSDDYDLDAVKTLSGTQNYGNLRIARLTGSFDLKGSSADVKIRNIDPSVSFINLDNKYSDIRFPVTGLKNYEVAFSGNYSSVFAPFERKDTVMENKPEQSTGATRYEGIGTGVVTVYSGTAAARKNNNGFSAVVGDTRGTHTKFNLTCTSCNVDFK